MRVDVRRAMIINHSPRVRGPSTRNRDKDKEIMVDIEVKRSICESSLCLGFRGQIPTYLILTHIGASSVD